MKTHKTSISWGYLQLIEIFAKANNLVLKCENVQNKIAISYDIDSDTDLAIGFMSIRHLGFENMLSDYLIKCGVHPEQIPIGKSAGPRDPAEIEEEWQVHRKKLGFR